MTYTDLTNSRPSYVANCWQQQQQQNQPPQLYEVVGFSVFFFVCVFLVPMLEFRNLHHFQTILMSCAFSGQIFMTRVQKLTMKFCSVTLLDKKNIEFRIHMRISFPQVHQQPPGGSPDSGIQSVAGSPAQQQPSPFNSSPSPLSHSSPRFYGSPYHINSAQVTFETLAVTLLN